MERMMDEKAPSYSVDVLPGRDGTWSVCVMNEDGEVSEAVSNVSLEAAIGLATGWAKKHRTKYRVADSPCTPDRN